MNILFRVDSSARIGLGHLMRCLVLAEQYKQDNTIFFAAQDLQGSAHHKIVNEGYELLLLNGHSSDELIQHIKKLNISLVVFDHYEIDDKFEKRVKLGTGVTILSLDDTYERHYCDILLNHNVYASADNYKGLVPKSCDIRCGSKYTLIRKDFKEVQSKRRVIDKNNVTVFVSLGGSDATDIGLKVLEILDGFDSVFVDFATTSANSNIDELEEFAKQHAQVNLCIDCNIAELMNSSDVAIITPSVISYEAMFLKLPFLAIQTAKNQRYVSEYLKEHHFLLGDAKNPDQLSSLIKKLLEQ